MYTCRESIRYNTLHTYGMMVFALLLLRGFIILNCYIYFNVYARVFFPSSSFSSFSAAASFVVCVRAVVYLIVNYVCHVKIVNQNK